MADRGVDVGGWVCAGGKGVSVGATGVSVGAGGVSVGDGAVGGTGVSETGTGVSAGGSEVAVDGTGVSVGGAGVLVGLRVGTVCRMAFWPGIAQDGQIEARQSKMPKASTKGHRDLIVFISCPS